MGRCERRRSWRCRTCWPDCRIPWAGHPEGVPAHDYIPLVALLRRRLSDDDIVAVATELIFTGGGRSTARTSAWRSPSSLTKCRRRRTPSVSSDAWLPSDGPSAIPSDRRNSNPPGHDAGDRPQGANERAGASHDPVLRSCPGSTVRRHPAPRSSPDEKSVTKAESQWRHRCEVEGDVDPLERLTLVRRRMEEAVKMLDALNARFPGTRAPGYSYARATPHSLYES